MTKHLVPLAVGISLLAGCATMDAFKTLQTSVQSNGIVLSRAFHYSGKAHVYLTWIRPDGSTIQNIKRYKGGTFEATVANPSSGTFVEDTATPPLISNTQYSYKLTFAKDGTTSEVNRFITPIDAPSDQATLVDPSYGGNANNLLTASTTPTLKWKKLSLALPADRTLSYMVTIAKLDPTTLTDPSKFSGNAGAAMDVAYSALIDPSKHENGENVEVAYGTKSDIGLATELMQALEKAGDSGGNNLSALKPKDTNVQPLVAGEKYAWTVAPIVITKDQTAFALGNLATPYFFQAQ